MSRSSGRLGASTVGALGGQKLLLALAGVVTARLLGPADKGLLALLTLAAAAASLAGAGGVEIWTARGGAATGPLEIVRWVVRRQVVVGGTVVAGLGVLLALAVPSGLLDGPQVATTTAAGLAGVAFLLASAVAINAERWGVWGWGQVLDGATFLVGCLALAVLDLAGVAAVLAVAALCRLATSAVVARPLMGPTQRSEMHRVALRFGIPAGLGGIALMATYRIDVVVLAWLRSPEEVGLYVTAAAVSEALWLLPDAVTPVILRRSGPHGVLDFALVSRIVLWSIIVGGGVLVLIGAPLLALVFGEEFRGASAALPGLWIASIALGCWKMLVADLATYGETRVRIWSAGLAIGGMVVADLVLVPAHGIVGAAWGSAIGYGLAAGGALWSEAAVARRRPLDLLAPRFSDLSAMPSLVHRIIRGGEPTL